MSAAFVALLVLCMVLIPAITVISLRLWKQQHAYAHAPAEVQLPPAAAFFVNPSFSSNLNSTSPSSTINSRAMTDTAEIYDSLVENPLKGLSGLPACTLEGAVAHAQVHCGGDLQAAVKKAVLFASQLAVDNKLGPLTVSEAASVHLYTQETPLYPYLNAALGDYGDWGKRASLHHYLPYVKLLRAALLKVPPLSATVVYRGVHMPLNQLIDSAHVGQEVQWWAFTSTSSSKKFPKEFIGSTGTLFQINSNDGRDISQYSDADGEEEVILLPGSKFVVSTINPYSHGIEEVQMNQLEAVYNGIDGGDGESTQYRVAVDPPVYDCLDYSLAVEGSIPSVVYSTYAGSAEIGPNATVYSNADGDGIEHDDIDVIQAADTATVGASGELDSVPEVRPRALTVWENQIPKVAVATATALKHGYENVSTAAAAQTKAVLAEQQHSQPVAAKLLTKHTYVNVRNVSAQVGLHPAEQHQLLLGQPRPTKHMDANVRDADVHANATSGKQQTQHHQLQQSIGMRGVKYGYVNVKDAAAQIKASTKGVNDGVKEIDAKGESKGIRRNDKARNGSVYDGFVNGSGGGSGEVGGIERQSGAQQGLVNTGFGGPSNSKWKQVATAPTPDATNNSNSSGAISRVDPGRASGVYGFEGGFVNEEEV